ncbi:MAG: hypothetical protein KDC00_06345 [Flavobacteriales bacterium]|nr:hypothetical protein [Flavobacteriales bacterium]
MSSLLHGQLWDQRADVGMALLDATGFAVGEHGFVFGGHDGATAQNILWRYTPSLDVWGSAGTFPGTIARACAGAALDGKGYVYGGRTGVGGQYSSALWSFDASTFQWTRKASKPGVGLAYSSAFSMNGILYVFGGSTPSNSYSNELWAYDPGTDQWTIRASLPAAGRSGTIALSLGGKGYIIGGNDASANFASRDVWEYDPAIDSWTRKSDMPGPERRTGCGFVLGGLAYAGGGWDGSDRFTDFYSYDPLTDVWTAISDFGGFGTYTPVGFATDNAGYVATGGASSGASAQCWAYVKGAIGLQEQADERFRPFRNGSEIVVDGWKQGRVGRFRVMDTDGRMVAEGSITRGRIALGAVANGTYVLNLIEPNGALFSWKFVVLE